jgi:spore coat polysaccharide biosynthesis predicted glycosyltransferase SpsG
MKVVFRADATRSVGAGHVMRCWALAEEFAGRGASVAWQGTIDVPWVRSALNEQGWEVLALSGSPRVQAGSVRADLVVVDSYTLEPSYRRALLDRGIPVVAIVDDSYAEGGPASLWVNPGAHSLLLVDDLTAFLNGPDYVLIRREVRNLRKVRQESISSGVTPSGITFLLGGTDFAGVARLLDDIPGLTQPAGQVFAGPGAGSTGSNLRWLDGGYELLHRASQSALAVSTAGVTSWELAHIGVPMALLRVADNQAGNYAWMTGEGWAFPLGRVHPGSDARIVGERLREALRVAADSPWVVNNRIDGLGAMRVADAALALV